MDRTDDRHERAAEILAHWQMERERGREDDPADLFRRHPELADELRDGLAAFALLDAAFAGMETSVAITSTGGGERRLGDFRILREIGRGGMGVVYEAEQVSMRRRVALKVLYPSVTLAPAAVERFRREAQAAGRLHHTHIVPVHAMGSEAGHWYYAMELVEGRPLDQVIRDLRHLRGPAPTEPDASPSGAFSTGAGTREEYVRIARAFHGVADALATAHAHGIVHRDVKPANLLLDGSGALEVLDFGLARVLDEGSGVTRTGDVVGTPAYMSPEQARSGEVDARADVYALGATLYEVLTLRPPFEGRDVSEVLAKVLSAEPPAPRRLDRRIPRDLETIVQKAMEKEPARRYASAADMARDLLLFAEGAAIRARRVGPIGRAVRAVRRHKGRAALVAGLAAAAVAVAILVPLFLSERSERRHEEARRLDMEYRALLAEASERFYGTREFDEKRVARDLYTKAIALLPDRPEAYLGRVLSFGEGWERALEDADAAGRRGASPRAVHLVKAFALRSLGRDGEAADEEALGRGSPAGDPMATYLEYEIARVQGDLAKAMPLLDRLVESQPRGDALRYMARRARSSLRQRRGDVQGALEDLLVLQAEGDKDAQLRVRAAEMWRRLGQAERAERDLARVLDDVKAARDVLLWGEFVGLLEELQDWAFAERAARAGLSDFPDDAGLLARLGTCLYWTGRTDDAYETARRAAARGPETHALAALLGNVHLRRAELPESLEAFRRAAALEPSCVGCAANVSHALSRLGRHEEAVAAARDAIHRQPSDATGYVALGEAYLWGGGTPDQARKAFERALSIRSEDANALTGLGIALHKTGDLDAAIQTLEKASLLAPQAPEPLRRMAFALYDKGRLDDALAAVERSLAIDDASAYAHGKRGIVLDAKGRLEEALAEYRRAMEIDPRDGEGAVNRAWAALRLGHPEEALVATEHALSLDPKDGLAHVQRAHALTLTGHPDQALEELDRARELGGSGTPDIDLAVRGQALERLGRYPEAVAMLRQAVQIDPAYGMHHAWLALALEHGGDEAAAIEEYATGLERGAWSPAVAERVTWWWVVHRGGEPEVLRRGGALAKAATESAPDTPGIWRALGAARLRLGDDRGAVEALSKAVAADEGDVAAALFLAMAHHRLGDEDEARRWYRKGAREAPAGDPLLAALRAEAEALLRTPAPSR